MKSTHRSRALAFATACLTLLSAHFGASAATLHTNAAIPGSEKNSMALVYELNLPAVNPSWRDATAIPYLLNNAAALNPLFANVPAVNRRLGYYMEVGSEFVYVSMNAFESNLTRVGYPHNVDNAVARQTLVSGANIYSNDPGITNTTGATVALEMWPSNYARETTGYYPGGSGSTFDYNDSGFTTGAGHASFQIHNPSAGQTLFGHNDWGGGNPGQASELGIGTNTTGIGDPDWTFSDTSASGVLRIYALIPEPSKALFGVLGAALFAVRRTRR